MIVHPLFRWTVAISLLLFGARAANAACVITGARPTVPLPTMDRGQEFVFIATNDCEGLSFSVVGTRPRRLSKIPNPGPDLGSKDRTYKVNLTEDEWISVTGGGSPTFTWHITGRTSTGGRTRVTTTNELDFDRDGWTRSEGDVRACDYSSKRNPGLAEICDGIDQDCDGLIDEDGVAWFRDADGDGYGDDADWRCTWAEGYVNVGGDCDDTDSGLWCTTLDLALADAKLVGEELTDQAGRSVSGAGDVNGDGKDDLLVGAFWNDEGGSAAGAAYLVLGPVTGTVDLSLADAKLVGERTADYAGSSVSGAGDVNGDGKDDLLVGAFWNDEGGSAAGAAYLVLGPVTGTLDLALADAKLVGERRDVAGHVSGAGDVDGDGHDDMLVGAPCNDEGGSYAGAAYLVLGPVTGTLDLTLADAKFVGEEISDQAGFVSGAGDVNGDGHDDVLVGAPYNDEGGSYAGAAYLVLGPVTGTLDLALADAKLVGERTHDNAYTVSGAGDVNGDGQDDLLVGAYNNDEGGSDAGAAYLVLGPVTGTLDLSLADTKLVGEESSDRAGESVSGAGDVDGDGHDDLLVGAGNNSDDKEGINAGAAYLVLGPVTGTLNLSRADTKLVGEEGDYAGCSVSGAGDVDGDGRDDVLVGACGAGAYLVYGGSLF